MISSDTPDGRERIATVSLAIKHVCEGSAALLGVGIDSSGKLSQVLGELCDELLAAGTAEAKRS